MNEPNVLHRVLRVSGALSRRRNKIRRGVHRMIHKEIIVKSGEKTLQKLTKTQARKEIQHGGRFQGYFCGNRVAPAHIADGWHLGISIDCETLDAFEEKLNAFEFGLRLHTPELGTYAHFYKLVDASERNRQLKRHYATRF